MKLLFKISLFLVASQLIFLNVVFCQAPQTFKYQTAIRDNSGNLLANKLVAIKISLLRTSASGPLVYIETHNVSTTDFGVANINIGNGNVVQGNFSQIDWANGPYFLKTELDINNGTNFLFMGTTQLLSVPFALYAAKSANAENDFDKDSLNEIQQMSLNGNQLQLNKAGGTINLDKYIDNTDSQSISLQGNTLSISRGNSIVLSGAIDLDSDPTNEIQNLSITKDTLRLSKSNYVILPKDNDTSATNEIQNLTKSGDTISISKGNSIILIKDNDRDSINEIQSIKMSNDTIYLSKSNYTILPKTNSVPSGTILTLDTFDTSLLTKGYSYIGRSIQNIENKVSDSTSWQWNLPLSKDNAGPGTYNHSAVWTGSEMIIFGSTIYGGRKYNLLNDTWSKISTINSPYAYGYCSSVWTGTEMLVWTNSDSNKIYRYNPIADIWTTITPLNSSNNPGNRYLNSAIWTGTDMILWGGGGPSGYNSGKKYNLVSNTWISISNINSPSVQNHASIWTGSEMIIWGGTKIDNSKDSILYKYNPITNSWIQSIGINSPSPRGSVRAVWTGTDMIIFGGDNSSGFCIDKTYRYNLLSNTWYKINDENKGPSPRKSHSAVWTGSEMIIWGGEDQFLGYLYDGYRFKNTNPTFGSKKSIYYHVFRKN